MNRNQFKIALMAVWNLLNCLVLRGLLYFLILDCLVIRSLFFGGGGAGGQGGNICLLFDLGDLRELGNKNFK